MKRLSVHAAFGLVAALTAAMAGLQGLALHRTLQLNEAIAAVSQRPAGAGADAMAAAEMAPAVAPRPATGVSDASAALPASTPTATPRDPAVARDAPREVRLAQATALSAQGAFDAAFKAYSGLIEPGRSDAIGQHAQYNLGNMVLRQGLSAASNVDRGPLIELAKQRYRDLLRADPQDWDARYNLERALRAAPEDEGAAAEQTNQPVERRNVSLRGMNPGDLP